MTATAEHEHVDGAECIHCKLDFPFVLPEELKEKAKDGNLVIFAGAGISTEVPSVFPRTVYDLAVSRLGVEDPGSFPEVMQAFQDRFGRQDLVRMVKKKFDFVDSFPGPRYESRMFHRELATMPYLRDIITTNWDTYFEEECQATPFVTGEDISLYGMPGRRVLKIHGSMNNLASIVATERDYAKRLDELSVNVLGSLLKQLLSTKTVIFIGYSLRDWNFRRLYQALRDDMNDYAPRAYIVSPFELPAKEDDFGLQHIKTSGIHFLRELKREMFGHCFLPDDSYDRLAALHDEVFDADQVAKAVNHKDYPAVIYCWSYHDGMKDACFRIANRRGSGEYSDRHHVQGMARKYQEMAERAYEQERFYDTAYIEGYLNCLMVLMDDEDEFFPLVPRYFVYGSDDDIMTPESFHEALKHSRRRAPKERAKAKAVSAKLPSGMVITHDPYLPDVPSKDW